MRDSVTNIVLLTPQPPLLSLLNIILLRFIITSSRVRQSSTTTNSGLAGSQYIDLTV